MGFCDGCSFDSFSMGFCDGGSFDSFSMGFCDGGSFDSFSMGFCDASVELSVEKALIFIIQLLISSWYLPIKFQLRYAGKVMYAQVRSLSDAFFFTLLLSPNFCMHLLFRFAHISSGELVVAKSFISRSQFTKRASSESRFG